MIELKDITMAYQDTIIFENLNLKINQGEFVGLVGPSGIGKSTILRLIAGLNKPTQGTVTINGKTRNQAAKKAAPKEIGYIFQDFGLFSNLTLLENMQIVSDDQHKIETLLKQYDIDSRKSAYPDELSGGQKQRLAISRALLLDPSILLIDEATSALDETLTQAFMEHMVKLNQEGKTILLITHDVGLVKQYNLKKVDFSDITKKTL